MRKLQSLLYFLFLLLFIPSLAFVTGLISLKLLNFDTILYLCTVRIMCILSFRLIQVHSSTINSSNKKYLAAIFTLGVLFFIIQLVNCLNNGAIPKKGDYEAIYTGIKNVVSYGSLCDSNLYFIFHPHQTFAMFLYSILNRIFVIMGSVDAVNYTASVISNCALISVGGILLSLAVSEHSDNCTGLFSMILFILCNSYWGCGIYLYTHTLSVFFLCFAIFCFSHSVKLNPSVKKLIWMLFCGIAFRLSKSSEGITVIALIAAIIYLFITCDTLKNFLKDTLAILICFFITVSAINYTYNYFEIFDYSDGHSAIPVTHWIMMGLSEDGVFVQEDYEATVNLFTKEERMEMHMKEIIKRIKDRTPSELISHFVKKENTVWTGGTYGCGITFINNSAYNYVYRFILILSLLICTLKIFIDSFKQKKFNPDFLAFFQIYIIGIFLFFCIWEISVIYLFSSLPMLICGCALSIYKIIENK